MSTKPQIGIRYCGGCNSRYDRVALAKRLMAVLPEYDFVGTEEGGTYAAVVILHGCLSRCTKTDDLNVADSQIVGMNGFEDLLPTKKRLIELVECQRMLQEKDYLKFSKEELKEILPHREPMLFVDQVTALVPGFQAEAKLFIDSAWDLFKGHFPDAPVFPGALITEAIAQTADLMMLTKELYKGKTPLFMGIDRASFRRKVEPGMEVTIKTSVAQEDEERGIVICKGQMFLPTGEMAATTQISLAFR